MEHAEAICISAQGGVKAALAGDEKMLLEMVMPPHVGMTTGAFESIVKDWIAIAKPPKTGKRLSPK